jgi:hypothetical protein
MVGSELYQNLAASATDRIGHQFAEDDEGFMKATIIRCPTP